MIHDPGIAVPIANDELQAVAEISLIRAGPPMIPDSELEFSHQTA